MFFFFQAEDGIRDYKVTGVQTCALPIFLRVQGGRLLVRREGLRSTAEVRQRVAFHLEGRGIVRPEPQEFPDGLEDRKSTRLNSSHLVISYAVFCLKKKKTQHITLHTHTQ